MRYRGAVNYYVNLPANPTPGDVWVVRYQGSSGTIPNGHAYCWEEATVSSEKTYIGDIPAYTDIVNHNPDIVNWLKSKEQRDLAWAAFTFGYGIFFMTPNSSAYLNTESQLNKRGNFLYPLVFNIGSSLVFRESQLAEQYTQYNADVFAFDYRDYNSIHKILDESSNNIYREYMSRTFSADASYKVILNGVTYNPYYFSFYNTSHTVASRPDNSQPSYINWVNGLSSTACADVDIMVHGALDQIQPANFVSNRLLLDVNGNVVQPSSSTYTYAYAGIEEELQWVDLGDLGGNLPSGKGKIYYNGICYSAGGGEDGKFFHREEIDTTTSNLIVVDNSTFTNPNSTPLAENIILLNNGSFTLIEDSDNAIKSNFFHLQKVGDLTSSITGKSFTNNFISQENGIITGSEFSNNFIFGKNNKVYSSDFFDSAIILGENNQYGTSIGRGNDTNSVLIGYNNIIYSTDVLMRPGHTVTIKEGAIFGGNDQYTGQPVFSDYIGSAEYMEDVHTLNNQLEGQFNLYDPDLEEWVDVWIGEQYLGSNYATSAYLLLGSSNTISKLGNDENSDRVGAIGASNVIQGIRSFVLGYDNTVSGAYTPSGSQDTNYWGNNIIIGNDVHVTGEYIKAFGRSINHSNAYEAVIIGQILNGSNMYESAVIGYNNIMASSTCCGIFGANTYYFSNNYYTYAIGIQNQATSSYYSYILGFNNSINSSNYGHIVGYNNTINNCSYEGAYIFGYTNRLTTANDSYVIGQENTVTSSMYNYAIGKNIYLLDGSNNNLIFGKGIELTTLSNKIRLGFYPLINDDFFAIGDGEHESSRSSVFRIDSNKNIYLNSTVPTPPIPTADGDYKLHVENGTATWVLLS